MTKLSDNYNLQKLCPDLAKEWHPAKNGSLTPRDVTPNSNKKVWWICSKNKKHEWEAAISDRNNGNGCPYCSGKRACIDNCLKTINPKLAGEWHPKKNGSLTSRDVAPNSNKIVWWQCSKNKNHEWESTINNRNKGKGCPNCSGKKACIDNCLKTINPKLAKEWHQTKNGSLTARDVTPNSQKKVWWLCSKKKNHEWDAIIGSRNNGRGCPYCSGNKVCIDNCLKTINSKLAKEWNPKKNGNLTPRDVTANSHKKVWWLCRKNQNHEWDATISDRNNGNGCPYCSGQKVCIDNCLKTINPKLAKDWHPDKNGNLTPRDVTANSHKKVWWLCRKNQNHEWDAAISDRNNGTGCPYCFRNKSKQGKRLLKPYGKLWIKQK